MMGRLEDVRAGLAEGGVWAGRKPGLGVEVVDAGGEIGCVCGLWGRNVTEVDRCRFAEHTVNPYEHGELMTVRLNATDEVDFLFLQSRLQQRIMHSKRPGAQWGLLSSGLLCPVSNMIRRSLRCNSTSYPGRMPVRPSCARISP